MTDQSEMRMNLAAIKRVDPYAKDIVDSSAHVAFYTFNSEETEWEKTDVEGAFFIYSRNAEPYYSIFINNRLNTNSLVEPIAGQLELQSQPPFLLYRNERSRIRGFWFYNKTECVRIGKLVEKLIKECSGGGNSGGGGGTATAKSKQQQQQQQPKTNLADIMTSRQKTMTTAAPSIFNMNKKSGVDIFTMLSKAQEDFNNAQVGTPVITSQSSESTKSININNNQPQQQQQQVDVTSQSVMNFFAAAKPATAKEVPFFQRMLSNPVHVDQIEKQHKHSSPPKQLTQQRQVSVPQQNLQPQAKSKNQNQSSTGTPANTTAVENGFGFVRIHSPNQNHINPNQELGSSPLATFINTANLSGMTRNNASGAASSSQVVIAGTSNVSELEFRQQPLAQLLKKPEISTTPGKPALMPPTMFTSAGPSAAIVTVAATSSSSSKLNNNNNNKKNNNVLMQKNDGPAPLPGLKPIQRTEQNLVLAVQKANIMDGNNPVPNMWQSQQQQTNDVLLQQQLMHHQHQQQHIRNMMNSGGQQPEPLTQSQLLQAMTYLIKNDPDFVRKLHEAYLKSFTEMVSL